MALASPRPVFLKEGPLGSARGLSVCARAALLCLSVSVLCVGYANDAAAQADFQEALEEQISSDAQMLLESDQIAYDFDRDQISAIGGVQIYYDGYTVEADRVTFDRRNGRLTAVGNVIMAEPGGNVLQTQQLQLSDDFAEGFASALQLDTPERTRFIADSATRTGGNLTTFENGLYTVYTSDRHPPDKPPLWRIRAAKIIHNQEERVIYYEDAALEFFGAPIAYLPRMSMPDPTVRRKSGFLMPGGVVADRLGVGVSIPYYWALSPHYDVTVTATPMTKQGVLGDIAFRQRTMTGAYSIAAAGLFQSRPNEFAGSSGDRRWRGALHTQGHFDLSKNWSWGWNLTYKSDRAFLKDYTTVSFTDNEETSEIYLAGNTDRNGLSFKGYAFSISQEDYDSSSTGHDPVGAFSPVGSSLQDKQPFVLPVIDYDYVFADPIAGGELAFTGNFTSLTRAETDAFSVNGVDRFRGVDGTFSRLSMEGDWRTTVIDPLGQVFTPFAYVKGDLFFLASTDKNVTALTGESFVGRAMPAAGIEYRYPIIATFDGGNQIVEPVAQIIVRPDEQRIGELPNEDAQSLVFDATTLFEYDKFSGFDRAEGGTRANVGLNYKLQMDNGYFVSALFGRSFALAGNNSYSQTDILGATVDSGLESDQSDYVGSLYLDTQYGIRLGAQARFDDKNFAVRRVQAQATASYGPLASSLSYAFLDEQPNLGIDDPREEILGSASLRIQDNWRVFGSLRYDLENDNVVQDGVGVGYDDEGFSMSLSYGEDRSRNNGDPVERLFFMRIGLRTLADTQVSSGALQ